MEGNFLKEPISIMDLLKSGKQFEIQSDFANDTGFENIDNFEDFNVDSDSEENNCVDHTDLISPWQKSFDELRMDMPKIQKHIYKKVITKGNNGGFPANRCQVSIDYNAYFENDTTPFDSTYLRGSQLVFIIGQNEVLTGIEEAVLTMTLGEESHFLISYNLLFRELGCMPRIKPKADALFVIKLCKLTEACDDITLEKLTEEYRNKYEVVITKVKDMHLKGLNEFQRGHYNNASKSFYKAVAALNVCHLSNPAEENEQLIFLAKLYTNLTVCYNKLGLPRKTCQMCNELRIINRMKNNAKALYNEGCAYISLCDYQQAQKSLLEAQKLNPANAEINKALKTLFLKKQKSSDNEKQIWTKAIGIISSAKNSDDKESNIQFKNNMRKMMEKFKSTDLNSITLHDPFKPEDVDTVSKLAEDIGLKLIISPSDEKMYILQKKAT